MSLCNGFVIALKEAISVEEAAELHHAILSLGGFASVTSVHLPDTWDSRQCGIPLGEHTDDPGADGESGVDGESFVPRLSGAHALPGAIVGFDVADGKDRSVYGVVSDDGKSVNFLGFPVKFTDELPNQEPVTLQDFNDNYLIAGLIRCEKKDNPFYPKEK